MARKESNIYKRKDGRWEARYVKEIGLDGRKKYGSVYGGTYTEAQQKRLEIMRNVVLSEVSLREDEYAEGAAVKFGTYLFHADSDETDLKQLIGKKINAKGLIVTQRTEIGKDPDHLDQTYEIELQISDVEVLGDAAESMSYIVVDNEFDNNFLVGQLYQFDIAWLESQNDAFDVLNYNTDGSILCQYNYSVYSMYTFDYEKMLRQYQGKQLFCMGVCRGTEEEKYIDITFIEVK